MVEERTPQAQTLIDRPSESLATELKTWINPETPEGQAILVKALFALRNHGGGQLLIGLANATSRPDAGPPGEQVRQAFHADTLQGLVSRFATEPFEVAVEFVERDGECLPVLFVPTGIRTPVATKSELKNRSGKILIPLDTVYVRTLRSNNTPSTARASGKDWGTLMDVCFENREADIGRFVRRHLSGLTPSSARALSDILGQAMAPSAPDRLEALLAAGERRFAALVAERGLSLPPTGFWSVACVIEGDVPAHAANESFMNLLGSSNPRYTGWPVWLDSRGFAKAASHPFVYEDTWQALLVDTGGWKHIDFHLWDPSGAFYVRRALQDDIGDSQQAPPPNTELDFGLQIVRCAEAIAVGLAFAKAMGCDPEATTLRFGFRWSGLKGRRLTSWAQQWRRLHENRTAQQDDVTVVQSVPLSTPPSAIGDALLPVLGKLFQAFGGFALSGKVIEDMTTELVERRMR